MLIKFADCFAGIWCLVSVVWISKKMIDFSKWYRVNEITLNLVERNRAGIICWIYIALTTLLTLVGIVLLFQST